MKGIILLTALSCAMLCGCGQGAAVVGTQETPEAVETAATESADVETESTDGSTAEQDEEYNARVLAGAFGIDRAALRQTVSALAAGGCSRIALINNIKDFSKGTDKQYTMDIEDTAGRNFVCTINSDGSLVKVDTFE